MTVELFADLIGALVREEALSLGVPAAEVVILRNTFTPDGGVDAEVRVAPATAGSYLRTKPVIAQFKRGTLTTAKARKEIRDHVRVRELIQRGFAYLLVLGADADGETLAELKEAIEDELARDGIARDALDVQVLAGSHLSNWISEYPALTGHRAFEAAGEPFFGELLTGHAWAQKEQHPWHGEEGRNEEVARLVERLGKRRATVRLIGPPGAGKTRFVLEAIRAAGLLERTVYSPAVYDRLRDILSKGTDIQRRKGVLVVDECTTDEASQLEQYRHPDADIRIVTIGASDDVYGRSTDPAVITLKPLGLKDAERVAADHLLEGTALHAPVVAARSNGYPKLVVLLCEVIRSNPDAQSILAIANHERLVQALKRLLGFPGPGEPVQVLCLPRQFGIDGNAERELLALAEASGFTAHALRAAAENLQRRELLGRAADFAYVTPFLLAEWLAGDLWRIRGARLFLELQRAHVPPRAMRSALFRLIDLGLEQQTMEVARNLLTSPDLFPDVAALDDEARASFVDELATLNPREAGALLGRLLRGESRDRLLRFTSGRRHVVWALQKVAWMRESFRDAACVLLRLADAEVETYGNNATGILKSLFLTHLGATAATGQERIEWLQQAWRDASENERILLLGAAAEALEMEGSGEASPFPDVLKQPDRWMPQTWEEEHAYRTGISEVVRTALKAESEGVRAEAEKVVASSLRSLFARDHADILLQLVTQMGERARKSGELARAMVRVKSFDLNHMSPRSRVAFENLERMLAPSSFEERLARALRVASWEAPEEAVVPPPDFDELAKSFIAASEASRPWSSLEAAEPERLFLFGQAVGRQDRQRLLLPALVERASQPLVLRLLAAYVTSLPASDAGSADDLLDAWARDPKMAKLALEATWLADPSDRAAARLISMLDNGQPPETDFSRLRYGGWLLRIPVDRAIEVLSHFHGAEVAFPLAFQLWHHMKPPAAAVTATCKGFWVQLTPVNVSRQAGAWEWQTFGSALVEQDALAAAQSAILFLDADDMALRDAAALVVASAMRHDPKRVWPEIASVLLDARKGRRAFTIYSSLAGKFDDKNATAVITDWARSSKEHRELAARLVGAPGPAGTLTLANSLLEAFPGDEAIIRTANRAYFYGVFWGPASAHYQVKRDAILEIRKTAGPGLRAWADSALREAEGHLEFGKRLDEAGTVDS